MRLHRFTGICLGSAAVVLAITVLAFPAIAAAPEGPTRHHIVLDLGYTKLLSDDLKDDALGIDFTNAANATLEYRFSLTPIVDLAIDSRATASTDEAGGVDVTLTNSYFGPGVRVNGSGSIRPYGQANFYFVSEHVEVKQGGITVSGDESDIGFGLSGGIDITLSKLLSMPLEVHYLNAKPQDDVSGVGFSVGLAFNFGAMQ